MAKTLTSTLALQLTGLYKNDTTALTGGVPSNNLAISVNDTMSTGTSANQSDLRYHARVTLATGNTDSYDLAGVLADVFGATLTFVEITMIYIQNLTTSTGAVLNVGGNANPLVNWVANGSDIVNVGPSGVFMLYSPVDGYAVTAATGDVLDVANASGTSITYDIVITGRSA